MKKAGQEIDGRIQAFWAAVGAFILRRHWYVNRACFAVLIGLGHRLFQIKTSVQLLKLFDSNSQIIRDYAWLGRKIFWTTGAHGIGGAISNRYATSGRSR